MHICPVCAAAALQIINDNSPFIHRMWFRLKFWTLGLFKKRNRYMDSAEELECMSRHAMRIGRPIITARQKRKKVPL